MPRDIKNTLNLIYQFAKKDKIVLLVDEFMKLAEPINQKDDKWKILLNDLLHTIHSIKDDYRNGDVPFRLITCVSSLNLMRLENHISSVRTITLQKLPKFDAQEFLIEHFKTNESPVLPDPTDTKRNEILKEIANTTGNFPRAVEYARKFLESKENRCYKGDVNLSKIVTTNVMQGLSNMYGVFFSKADIGVILSLVGIKIWVLKVSKIIVEKESFDQELLMRNGKS